MHVQVLSAHPVDLYWRVSMFLWLISSLVFPLERDPWDHLPNNTPGKGTLVIWCSVALTVITYDLSLHHLADPNTQSPSPVYFCFKLCLGMFVLGVQGHLEPHPNGVATPYSSHPHTSCSLKAHSY